MPEQIPVRSRRTSKPARHRQPLYLMRLHPGSRLTEQGRRCTEPTSPASASPRLHQDGALSPVSADGSVHASQIRRQQFRPTGSTARHGGVYSFGGAGFYGSASSLQLN